MMDGAIFKIADHSVMTPLHKGFLWPLGDSWAEVPKTTNNDAECIAEKARYRPVKCGIPIMV